jgi:hypothetical protein
MVNHTSCSPSLTLSQCVSECSAFVDEGPGCESELLAVYHCAAAVPGSSWSCNELVSPFSCDSATGSTTVSEAVCADEQTAASNC